MNDFDDDLEKSRERHESRYVAGIDNPADSLSEYSTAFDAVDDDFAMQAICQLVEGEYRDNIAEAIRNRDHGALANVADSIRDRVAERFEARR